MSEALENPLMLFSVKNFTHPILLEILARVKVSYSIMSGFDAIGLKGMF